MARVTKTVTLSLPPEMDKKISALLKKEGRTRSELFREALRRYMEEQECKEITRYGRLRAKEKGVTEDQIEDIVDARRK
jgi:CopG family transcriptional regulator / antitoxin EndoAI